MFCENNCYDNKEYSYDFFQNISKTLDRSKNKLPSETIDIFYEIKSKLKIKEFSDIKKENVFERPVKKKGDTINELYKVLNKITDKTYDKLSKEIINIIDNLDDDDLKKTDFISNRIFQIISNSSINSKLYAKLYNDIIKKHSYFKNLFTENIELYLENFKKIDYVSPNENYDKFCLYIKHIEKMKFFTLFMIQCMYFSICDLDHIIDILLYFQDRSLETLHLAEHITENEQIIDTLYLIIKEIIDFAILHEKWEKIIDNHNKLHRFNGAGKNNKIRFKLMDIEECITNNK